MDPLFEHLAADNPEWRKEALAQIVARGTAAVPALLELAVKGAPAQRIGAIQALALLRDARGLPVVLGALAEPERAVAIAAERSLGHWARADETAAQALKKHLETPGAKGRARALRCWAELGEPGAVDAVLLWLNDSEPSVRMAAAAALKTLDETWAKSVLPGLLLDDATEVREAVAEVLVELDSDAGRSVLENAEDQTWAAPLLARLGAAR